MQWVGLPRAFPLRTVLLLCSVPVMALATFVAWFRWELPPLEGYYLTAYWESSSTANNPEGTTQFRWLNKAAPGRKSMPVIPRDVDSGGSGLLPIELSSSALEQGWDHLEMLPIETVSSSGLAAFLRENVYGNRSFRQVIAEPLFFLCVIPFILLYIAIIMRRVLAAEWRRAYEELYDHELAFDSGGLRNQLWSAIRICIHRQIANAKSRLWSLKSTSSLQSHPVANADAHRTEIDGEKPLLSDTSSMIPQRHSIFPGAPSTRGGNLPPKPWDESQWID
jgi:hypothetical protein